ncbi:hypothetical protein F2C03_06865 [Salmonella enterica]|nr:hypothetical protein [Salmonella enterica]
MSGVLTIWPGWIRCCAMSSRRSFMVIPVLTFCASRHIFASGLTLATWRIALLRGHSAIARQSMLLTLSRMKWLHIWLTARSSAPSPHCLIATTGIHGNMPLPGGIMEQNLDLFAGRDELEPLVDNLHLIPDEEREKLWTGTLSDLLAVMLSEMKRAGVDEQQALNLSERLTIALSGYMGGRSLYLPAGGRLKTAVRDMLIYAEFNGRNIQHLQKKYRLSEPQVYAILKRERDVYIRRRQISLI